MYQKEDVNFLAELSGGSETAIPEVSAEELTRFQKVKAPTVRRQSFDELSRQASVLNGGILSLNSTAVMELSARKPYHSFGLMDFYQPGRWDASWNLVFMRGIVYGPSPGQWDGTVGYLQFKAPTTATYLVVSNFSGYQTTMKMSGTWGTATGYTATTSDSGTVLALWSGTAGSSLYFYLSCVGAVLGYLESVQVYKFG